MERENKFMQIDAITLVKLKDLGTPVLLTKIYADRDDK